MARLVCAILGFIAGVAGTLLLDLVLTRQAAPIVNADPSIETHLAVSALDPASFAIVACGNDRLRETAPALCVSIVAGGKRFLFGAPQGVVNHIDQPPDAVFLTGVSGRQIAGLSELRFETWMMNRQSALNIFGPAPIVDIVEHLNLTQEVSDASTYVSVEPQLVFDGAPLAAKEVLLNEMSVVFDSGDVQVSGVSGFDTNGTDVASYRIDYNGQSIVVLGCKGGVREELVSAPVDVLLLPAIDLSRSLERRRKLKIVGHRSRLLAAERAARDCRSSSDALDLAREAGIGTVFIQSELGADLDMATGETEIFFSSTSPFIVETQPTQP